MTTATDSNVQTQTATMPERFVFRNVGWDGYQRLLKLVENRRVRVTYDRGDVEIMAPLSVHERYKSLLGRMIDILTEELNLRAVAAGSTTFNSEALDRGLEPDECYYFASAARVQNWDRIDLLVDPPPDLAVEVDITSSSLDRRGVYAALGVPELWRFDGEAMSVLVLGPDGAYAPSAFSPTFPSLPMDELAAFLLDHRRGDDTRWAREFREWARRVVVPGHP